MRLDDLKPLPPDPEPMEQVRRDPEPVDAPMDLGPPPADLDPERGPRGWDDGADDLRGEIELDAQRAEAHARLSRPTFYQDMVASAAGGFAATLIVHLPLGFFLLTMVIPRSSALEGMGLTYVRLLFAHFIANGFLAVGTAFAQSWRGDKSTALIGGLGIAFVGPISATAFFLGSGLLLETGPKAVGVTEIHANVIEQMLERPAVVMGLAVILFLRIGTWYWAARSVDKGGIANRGYGLAILGLIGILGTCLIGPILLITEPAAFGVVRGVIIHRLSADDRAAARALIGGREPV